MRPVAFGTGSVFLSLNKAMEGITKVCKKKLQCKEVKNTTSLLSINSVVNKMTCFSLLGGHHQVQQVLAIGD